MGYNSLGADGFPPNQVVVGHGMSDLAETLLVDGDHHQNDFVSRISLRMAPFIQALRLRGVAAMEIQQAITEQRVRRMLARNAQYNPRTVRVGDCVAFHRPRSEKEGKKHEALWFGPSEAIHFSGATFHVIYLGGIYSGPYHLAEA